MFTYWRVAWSSFFANLKNHSFLARFSKKPCRQPTIRDPIRNEYVDIEVRKLECVTFFFFFNWTNQFYVHRYRRVIANRELWHVAVSVATFAQNHGIPRAQPDAYIQSGHRFWTDSDVGCNRLQQPGTGHDATKPGCRSVAQQLPQHFQQVIPESMDRSFRTQDYTLGSDWINELNNEIKENFLFLLWLRCQWRPVVGHL